MKSRRVNPKYLARACLIGLSVGIPAVAMLPWFIEAREGATIPIGSGCAYQGDPQWVIESHTDDGGYIILDYRTYERRKVKKREVVINLKDVPSEYHWYHGLLGR